MTSDDNEHDLDDVTLPAGGDVVAQIRAHAAKVRRGEIAADAEIDVWIPSEEAAPAQSSQRFVGDRDRPVLPHDDTVAFSADAPVPASAPAEVLGEGVDSLIDGLGPPEVSATFWGPDRRFRSSGTDAKPRRARSEPVPLAMWVAAVALIIVIVSVGIAFAVATTVPFS